jgi:hypothetical protein
LKEPLNREQAEILALEALAWLAGQPDAIARFLTISGLQASVLDYLLANESLLLEFCQSASLKPQAVHAARYRLES